MINSNFSRTAFVLYFLISGSLVSAEGQVGAIGILQPESTVLNLTGLGRSTISEIFIESDQKVKKGDVLVRFTNYEVLKAKHELAQLSYSSHKKTINDNIDRQRKKITKYKAFYKRAGADLASYKKLNSQSISKKEMMHRERLVEDAKSKLSLENLLFKQLTSELKLKLNIAKTQITLAEEYLKTSVLIAPIDGVILEVNNQIGESVSSRPVVRMASLDSMIVLCKVYEGDLLKIKHGMKVKLSNNSLPNELTGVVFQVGRIVKSKKKLADVWVRLDHADEAAKMIGMEVQATIYY